MPNNTSDIRRLMNLMESTLVQPPVLLEGWVDKLAGVFNGKSLGQAERAKMAKELVKEWNTWLGQTDRTGDLDDMIRFMKMRVGFNDQDISLVLDRAGIQVQGASSPEPEQDDEEEAEKPKAAQSPSEDKPGYDPEEGVPVPKDLDTKIGDYKDLGKPEEKILNDNPKKYLLGNGEFDKQKIRARLRKLPIGTTLKLGNRSWRITTEESKNESINEADEPREYGLEDILDSKKIKELMDYVAAQVNDAYLLDGPSRDQDGAYGSRGRSRMGNRTNSNSTQPADGADDAPSSRGPGSYNSKMMKNILKSELEVTDASQQGIAQKVIKVTQQYAHNGMGHMTPSDMETLAKIGYAFIRSKS